MDRLGPMAPRANGLRSVIGPLVAASLASALAVVLRLISPERPGRYLVCPLHALTGLYCPGCGGLRAVAALTHGDLALALHRNPLVVLAVPVAVALWAAWVRRSVSGAARTWYPSPRLLQVTGLVLLAFTVLRNIPGFGVLGP